MTAIVEVAGWTALGVGAGITATGAWWTLQSLVALRAPEELPEAPAALGSITIIVPAHDEAAHVEGCVRSLLESARFAIARGDVATVEVIVVADNCSDRTADLARAAGAEVIVRDDPTRRGKPFALSHALTVLASRERAPDAVAFVDGDSAVSRDFVRALAWRLSSGERAVQAYYAAGNAEGELPALRRLAFALLHWARPLGAERMRLGTGIKGNGYALEWQLARHGVGQGLAEDAALTVSLARQGVRVAFEPRASVVGEMAGSYEGATTQDARWEGGRIALMSSAAASALQALNAGRLPAAAAALEVALPPLSLLVAGALTSAAVGALVPVGPRWLAVLPPASIVAYVVAGLAAAPVARRDLLALRGAPRFALHKLRVLGGVLVSRRSSEWERTPR